MTHKYVNGELVELTADEEKVLEAQKKIDIVESLEMEKKEKRQKRNDLLAASDWTQANDSPLANDKKIEWATYRTALRDLPSNKSWPDVTFPEEPS